MSITGNIQITVDVGGVSVTSSNQVTGSGAVIVNENIPDESVDLEVVVPLDFSALKIFYMESDQDLTIETNSASEPDDTIALTAGQPILYSSDMGESANPFSADVTTLYVANASGSDATLKIQALTDVTP